MKIFTNVVRIFTGLLFMFSGFIKANDSLGFAYKLTEYFEVFGTPFFIPIVLPLAMFICIFEILLGFTLLIGARIKLTLWLLLLMVVFFTFLTFYSAYFDKVHECGCFGDFWHLTPWQSFGKDIFCLILIIILFIGKQYLNPIVGRRFENMLVIFFTAITTAFPIYTYNYLPVKDFRPYKIGTDLYKAIHPKVKFFYTLKNKKTGKPEEFDSWPPNWETDYEYVGNRTEPIDKSVEAIIGFTMQNEYGEDYTDEFLLKDTYKFIVVEYDLNKANKAIQGKLNDFAALCTQNNIEIIGLTSSDRLTLRVFKKENNMWHYHTIPSFDDVKEKYFKK